MTASTRANTTIDIPNMSMANISMADSQATTITLGTKRPGKEKSQEALIKDL